MQKSITPERAQSCDLASVSVYAPCEGVMSARPRLSVMCCAVHWGLQLDHQTHCSREAAHVSRASRSKETANL